MKANLDICVNHVVKDTCQRMASDFMKSLMKLATHIVQHKVVRVGGLPKKQRKDIKQKLHSDQVQEHRCEFCPQHKPFRTVWDLKQHLERCPANTPESKRQPVACDICKKGNYYNPKTIKVHKKQNMGGKFEF